MFRTHFCQTRWAFFFIGVAAFPPGVHVAQCEDVWSLVATSGPPAAGGAALTFDEARGVSLLFVLGETWTWDGLQWSLVSTSGPSARWEHTMAYDSLRARVVLFGGRDTNSTFGDTWEWDGSSWSLRATTGPDPRYGHVACFQPSRAATTLFGGYSPLLGMLHDTWIWNGASWSQLSLSLEPPPRIYSSLALTNSSGTLRLFGGGVDHAPGGGLSESVGESWRISTSNWSSSSPCEVGARQQSGMVFDSARNRIVLFGGYGYDEFFRSDTWEQVNLSWSLVARVGPSGRRAVAMAYDSLRARTVLFGGITEAGPSAETWEFVPVTAATTPGALLASEIRKGVTLLTWTPDPLTASSTTIERERLSGGVWSETTTAGIVAPGPTQFLDLPGTGTFRYRLQASSCVGTSAWSPEVVVGPTAPGAPLGSLASRRTAVLNWTDRSDFESSFEVQRERSLSGSSGPWIQTILVATLPADTTTFSERPGPGTWRYRLRATNPEGVSDWTAWKVITIR